jgi:hypothetical protein
VFLFDTDTVFRCHVDTTPNDALYINVGGANVGMHRKKVEELCQLPAGHLISFLSLFLQLHAATDDSNGWL